MTILGNPAALLRARRLRSAAALRAMLGESMSPIAFDASLAQAVAPARYTAFITDWRESLGRPLRR